MGLVEYTSFIEWNNDANIADAAQALYGDIDNLELYVSVTLALPPK